MQYIYLHDLIQHLCISQGINMSIPEQSITDSHITNQLINHSINQSINQSINESINRLINQSIN